MTVSVYNNKTGIHNCQILTELFRYFTDSSEFLIFQLNDSKERSFKPIGKLLMQ